MQECVQTFALFFSDIVLNAQLFERNNDRYSKNWASASWFFAQLVLQLRHLCKNYQNSNFQTDYLCESVSIQSLAVEINDRW